MFGKLGNLVAAGLAVFGGYELWNRWLGPELGANKVTLTTGHYYALVFDYTSDPSAPLTVAEAQSALDSVLPGQFKVLTASLVPGPMVQTRQFALSVEYMGQTAGVQTKTITAGFGAQAAPGLGRVSLVSAQDMGVSPTASGTAAAMATS